MPTDQWRMWQWSPLIAECVRLKIVDALLTLPFITLTQPSYTHYMYATNCILIIDIQHCISEYYHLHPGSLLHHNFWSTSIQGIWARNEMALLHSCAFGRQFVARRFFHLFWVNTARLRHRCSSSFFCSMSMTYHKQFQLSQPCAPGLCWALCSWMHGWLQHNGQHSDRFLLGTDHSSYDSSDITHLNFVCISHPLFSCCFLTSQ